MFATVVVQVQPPVQKFADTEAWYEIDLELIGPKAFTADVKVAFEWRNRPARRSFGEDDN